MTHAELVELAGKWLWRHHSVVLTELVTQGETPDALGFNGSHTTLIECKTSRSDFAADAKKPFRREAWTGIGNERYYMVPQGLIKPEELPLGWGLLEVKPNNKVVCTVKTEHSFFEKNARHEITILVSALRRTGQTAPSGVSVKCYTYGTKNTATLGVAEYDDIELDTFASQQVELNERT